MTINYRLSLKLFVTFLKIGAFTIGGGLAMLPIIQHEMVVKHKWLEEEEVYDYVTIAQSIPGVIGINMATLVGYKLLGTFGAILCTFAMILPSFITIVIIALAFDQFQQSDILQRAFKGIRASVVALLLSAVVKMAKTSIDSFWRIAIAVVCAAAALFFDIAAYWLILFGAVAGILLNSFLIKNEVTKNEHDS